MKFSKAFDFSDKVVCITGALGLIGQKVCEAFLDYNATVIACDLQDSIDEHKNSEHNEKLKYETLNIADQTSTDECINNILKKYHRVDVWVNLAYPRTSDWGNTIEEVSLESFNQNCSSHLGGYFWSSKKITEIMKNQGGGSLINCGSIYGVVGPDFELYPEGMTMPIAYSAIKAGIINMSKYLATMYGKYGVRVNSICPGGVENNQPLDFINNYSKNTPLKRLAKAEEIAMPILFLASDAASYITGETLMVDGGWTAK